MIDRQVGLSSAHRSRRRRGHLDPRHRWRPMAVSSHPIAAAFDLPLPDALCRPRCGSPGLHMAGAGGSHSTFQRSYSPCSPFDEPLSASAAEVGQVIFPSPSRNRLSQSVGLRVASLPTARLGALGRRCFRRRPPLGFAPEREVGSFCVAVIVAATALAVRVIDRQWPLRLPVQLSVARIVKV